MTAIEEPAVTTTLSSGVLTVSLRRPKTLNSINPQLMKELTDALRSAASDPDVRAVVLHGEGRGFCSGWDSHSLSSTSEEALAMDAAGLETVASIRSLPQPTIAALHGGTIGAGLLLAASCDLRVATRDSYFWLPEVIYGSPVLWSGLGPLVREIGFPATRDLAMSGERRDAEWALRVGLVQQVVDEAAATDAAAQIAGKLAGMHPRGLRLMKRNLAGIEAELLSPTPNFTPDEIVESLESDEFRSAMSARN